MLSGLNIPPDPRGRGPLRTLPVSWHNMLTHSSCSRRPPLGFYLVSSIWRIYGVCGSHSNWSFHGLKCKICDDIDRKHRECVPALVLWEVVVAGARWQHRPINPPRPRALRCRVLPFILIYLRPARLCLNLCSSCFSPLFELLDETSLSCHGMDYAGREVFLRIMFAFVRGGALSMRGAM